jgi:hypothetical protein
MGNRAVITTAPYSKNNVGIYVHWNGGRSSIDGFLQACKRLGYRAPGADDSYAMARLTQAIATYFGGSTSVGIGTVSGLDADNGDNGLYVIGGDWEIVARKYYEGPEEADPAKTSEIADKIVATLADNAKD